MQSKIAERLKLRYAPVVIVLTDEKPANATEFVEGRRGCVVTLLTAAMKGRQVVLSRKNFGCIGGAAGLGFGNLYPHFPGGFEYFLSIGRGEGYPEGEAYKKTPELVESFLKIMPFMDIPYEYVVFKPLYDLVIGKEEPQIIVFYANPDQLSALVVLANYGRTGNDNVAIPFAAGCQSCCLLPLNEAAREQPKAIVGMIDITARPFIDADLLSFSLPFSMFQEMENNVASSFLDKPAWQKIAERISEKA
jgi:uncharacterized protein (DUF169 family)